MVVVTRPHELAGAARRIEVTDNGRTVGKLGSGGVLAWQRPEGTMELNLTPTFLVVLKREPIRVDVRAGEVYRFTAELKPVHGSILVDKTFALIPAPVGSSTEDPEADAVKPPAMLCDPEASGACNGFSIEPPRAPGWLKTGFSLDRVVFEKRASSQGHRVFLGVERSATRPVRTPEEFLDYVRSTYFVAGPELREFEAEANLDDKNGPFCVKYRYSYQEANAGIPGAAPYVVHNGQGYVCRHPQVPDYELDVCRSEEYAPGQDDPQLHAEEGDFIEKFAFTRLAVKTRAYVLRHVVAVSAMLVELDGKRLAVLSECGEIATAESGPGDHSIKAFYGGIGRADVTSRPERKFETPPGRSSYFVVEQVADDLSTFLPTIKIREVTKDDWTSLAKSGANHPVCRRRHRE